MVNVIEPIAEFYRKTFETPFEKTQFAKILEHLPTLTENGPWLAGGSVRRLLQNKPLDTDFDFFFHHENQFEEFQSDLESRGFFKVNETNHHIEMKGSIPGKEIRVQLIKFLYYADASHVIDSFDFTICQFLFDGINLITTSDALCDLYRGKLRIYTITFPEASIRRMLKYAQQGFTPLQSTYSELLRAGSDPALMKNRSSY